MDVDIRSAERDDPIKARRLRHQRGEGPRHKTADGRTIGLHEFADSHLLNTVKLKLRRFVLTFGDTVMQLNTMHSNDYTYRVWAVEHEEWLQELEDRNIDPELLYAYYFKTICRYCEECGEPRSGKPHGSTDRLQCSDCALQWEFRCMTCNKKVDGPGKCECGTYHMWVKKNVD